MWRGGWPNCTDRRCSSIEWSRLFDLPEDAMPSKITCRRIRWLLAGILAAVISAGIAIPAGSGWDFANFYDAGHKVLVGQIQDLYDADAAIAGKPPEGHLAYYGTPLSALLMAPLALMPPGAAMVIFKIQASLA